VQSVWYQPAFSEEHIASIFGVQEQDAHETSAETGSKWDSVLDDFCCNEQQDVVIFLKTELLKELATSLLSNADDISSVFLRG
jgi:hypothetical protein